MAGGFGLGWGGSESPKLAHSRLTGSQLILIIQESPPSLLIRH